MIDILSSYGAKQMEVSNMGLAEKTCVPCRGGVPPLTAEQIKPLVSQVDSWNVVQNHHLEKEFKFQDFKTALDFVNKVGGIAEEQGHHPDIYLAWGKARVTIWTHKIDGLTESDFILAAKVDRAA
jgi:4a-hydroxytetrahydrobiopterin dehydratase